MGTQRGKYIQPPVVALRRAGKGQTPLGYFPSCVKVEHKGGAHPTAPTPSPLSAGNRSGVQVVFTPRTSAWTCHVWTANPDSGYGWTNQSWSPRTSCGCSSCRRSSSGSCSGSCCGWRCCSKTRRWLSDWWRKDWGGSKGWDAFWHWGEKNTSISAYTSRAGTREQSVWGWM